MLGKNIKKFRNKMNLSQEALAQKAGTTWSSIVKIETSPDANPTIKTLVKIADALEVSLDELVGRK